jgi:mannose-1-phosphate guanylyltransferase
VISSRYKDLDDNEILIAVLTADHKIEPKQKFIEVVGEALDYVAQNQALATIGIIPARAETGYGYIELDNFISGRISGVKCFKEKPDLKSAQKYISSGNFLWNSGMFFWKLSTFNSEMKLCYPEIGNRINELSMLYDDCISEVLDTFNLSAVDLFESLPSISIDYALMEKSSKVVCVKSEFDWDDVGAWDSLERVRSSDSQGNILSGNTLLLDSSNCIVINENSDKVKVTGVGLDNLIIINTGDSIMICPKNKAQDVKLIVNELRSMGETDLL